jgi:hypothetical protein
LASASSAEREIEPGAQVEPLHPEHRADGVVVGGAGWERDAACGLARHRSGHTELPGGPDGTAGVYFVELTLKDRDLQATVRMVHELGIKSLPDGPSAWRVLRAEETFESDRAEMLTDVYKADTKYLISQRIIGQHKSIVRMTFHGYDCADPKHSSHRPEVWLASLRLTEGDSR